MSLWDFCLNPLRSPCLMTSAAVLPTHAQLMTCQPQTGLTTPFSAHGSYIAVHARFFGLLLPIWLSVQPSQPLLRWPLSPFTFTRNGTFLPSYGGMLYLALLSPHPKIHSNAQICIHSLGPHHLMLPMWPANSVFFHLLFYRFSW